MTQEELSALAAELAEQSSEKGALAAEALAGQWLTEPNRTFVVEKNKEKK